MILSGVIPTVGRIVHYMNLGDKDGKYPPETQAAMITSVKPGANTAHAEAERNCDVTLAVFYRTGLFFMVDPVPFSPEPARGHWTWPPRM